MVGKHLTYVIYLILMIASIGWLRLLSFHRRIERVARWLAKVTLQAAEPASEGVLRPSTAQTLLPKEVPGWPCLGLRPPWPTVRFRHPALSSVEAATCLQSSPIPRSSPLGSCWSQRDGGCTKPLEFQAQAWAAFSFLPGPAGRESGSGAALESKLRVDV